MTSIDTDRPSLTIVKSFPYRGTTEEYTNTYFFTGDTPSNAAAWKGLADDVIADEKAVQLTTTSIVRAIGHEAGESVAVWTYDYAAHSESVAGTYAITGSEVEGGGDSAVWVRWSTDQLTSKGKPIYLRSYFHPAPAEGSSSMIRDNVADDWQTAGQAFGDAWIAGYDVDGDTRVRCGPHGAVGLVAQPSTFVTTRTLKRRGRRPTTP